MKEKDITRVFNDAEIESLARDKALIRADAQKLRTELESSNPNIQIIHEFKQKLSDFQAKEKVLKECESFI